MKGFKIYSPLKKKKSFLKRCTNNYKRENKSLKSSAIYCTVNTAICLIFTGEEKKE